MKIIVRKTVLVVMLLLLVQAAIPVMAQAYTVWWYAGSMEQTNSGRGMAWPGVHAYNYVMNNPTIYNKHVNSIYLRRDDMGRGYEVGWRWPAGEYAQPQWFAVVTYNYVNYEFSGPIAQRDNNNLLTVEVSGDTALMKVDTTVIYSETARMAYGYPNTGSERRDSNETNYAHFWHLMRKDWDGAWYYWSNQKVWLDIDPEYWVNRNGHVEVWVQHL